MKQHVEPILLIAAIFAGSLTGSLLNFAFPYVDFFIIAMLFFLFYNISFDGIVRVKNSKYVCVAWVSNFIIIPALAFLLASLFVDRSSAIFVGLILYLVAPCTDWFLGFTKLAGGDVEINSALLPINLLSQILLLPIYLYLFTANSMIIPLDSFFDVLINWVVFPFACAQAVRIVVRKVNTKLFMKTEPLAEYGMLVSVVLLVFGIFHSNITSLLDSLSLLPTVLLVIAMFFVLTYALMKFLASKFAFSKKQEVSLLMTTAARNAPLMLSLSLGLFPQATTIHLVLIMGMLLEFPHLTVITYTLKK